MVMSRLDYCNTALAGQPQATVAPLQRVQNSAARLIFELSTGEHACLLQLHPIYTTLQGASSSNYFAASYALSVLRDVFMSVSDEHY